MTEPTPQYQARAGMYRLLVGYGAMTLTNDPNGPAMYRSTLDATLADTHACDIVTYLAGAAFGGYIEKCGGDTQAAVALIVRELRAAEDLAGLEEGSNTDG
jgi:hypothetical protein